LHSSQNIVAHFTDYALWSIPNHNWLQKQSFWYFGRTPWTEDQSKKKRPLPRQKDADIHPCLERNSNPRSRCL